MTGTLKTLGYGGSGVIGSKQVLITGGAFDTAISPSFLQPLDINPNTESRSRVLHADGVESYTGSLSFDVTDNFLEELTTSKLFRRRYQFNVGYDDGESSWGMTGCYLTSLNLSGSAGGLITGSISFMGASKAASPSSFILSNAYIGFQGGQEEDYPLGYWYSGNTNVRDWSLAMNQEVSPVYLNKNSTAPQYLKVGVVTYTLQVTTYEQNYNHLSVDISTKSFSLTGVKTSSGSSYGGQSELGGYTNTYESAADAATGSGAVVIT